MKCFYSKLIQVAVAGIRPAAPTVALLLIALSATAHERRQAEETRLLPSDLQVPAGNELVFRATGVGVQIYVWTVNATDPSLSAWVLKAPHALLFHHEGKVVGIHFTGPTWESESGSKIGGKRWRASQSTPLPSPGCCSKA